MKIIDQHGHGLDDLVVARTGRILFSPLPNVATAITPGTSTAYFVYVGRTMQPFVAKYIEFFVNSPVQLTTVGEVGLFSTPSAPHKANQTVTKLCVVNALDPVTTTGVKRNTNALDYSVAAGTYLWAGIRLQMATHPMLAGLCMDFSEGFVLSYVTYGSPLTDAGPWNAQRVALGQYLSSAIAPDLRITLD